MFDGRYDREPVRRVEAVFDGAIDLAGAERAPDAARDNALVSREVCLEVLGRAERLLVPTSVVERLRSAEDAVTIALRTQQIIAEESGVTNTIDPLGGSYYVESLTAELERRGVALTVYTQDDPTFPEGVTRLAHDEDLAWAVRKGSPQLLAGLFEDRAQSAGILDTSSRYTGWGGNFLDADNDADDRRLMAPSQNL